MQNREAEYKPLECYVCTLPENCIIIDKDGSNSDSLPAKQLSLTVKRFSITEQCMESVHTMVENYNATKELNSHQKTKKG